MNKAKIVAIYARQSADKRDSCEIETQIELCQKKAAELSYPKSRVRTFKDKGFSGGNPNRPDYKELASLIENDLVELVIVYRLDRISRNVIDFYDLYKVMKNHQCKFISATESQIDTTTPSGEFNMGILAIFAELERSNLKQRINDNQQYRIKNGGWCSGTAPFGFKNSKKSKQDKLAYLIPIQEELDIVRIIFDKYEKDISVSVRGLQKYLKDSGVKSKKGNVIGFNTVSKILRNPIYAIADGALYTYFASRNFEFVNDRELWDGSHSCIILYHNENNEKDRVYLSNLQGFIDSRTFITVQKRLEQNQAFSQDNEPKHKLQELSGLLKCKECGRAIKMFKAPTLSCSGRAQRLGCDVSLAGIRLETIQDKVNTEIQKYLDDFEKQQKKKQQKVNRDKKKLKQLEEELVNLIDVAKQGKIASDILARDIERTQLKINELQVNIQLDVNATDLIDFRVGIIPIDKEKQTKVIYADLDTEKKQSILKILVDRILVDSDGNVEIVFKE